MYAVRWIQKGKPSNGPQGIPVVMFRHLPRTGQLQVCENVAKTYLLYISQHDRLEDMRRRQVGGGCGRYEGALVINT